MRKTSIPASDNPLGISIAFDPDGDLVGSPGYLFHINRKGMYAAILNH